MHKDSISGFFSGERQKESDIESILKQIPPLQSPLEKDLHLNNSNSQDPSGSQISPFNRNNNFGLWTISSNQFPQVNGQYFDAFTQISQQPAANANINANSQAYYPPLNEKLTTNDQNPFFGHGLPQFPPQHQQFQNQQLNPQIPQFSGFSNRIIFNSPQQNVPMYVDENLVSSMDGSFFGDDVEEGNEERIGNMFALDGTGSSFSSLSSHPKGPQSLPSYQSSNMYVQTHLPTTNLAATQQSLYSRSPNIDFQTEYDMNMFNQLSSEFSSPSSSFSPGNSFAYSTNNGSPSSVLKQQMLNNNGKPNKYTEHPLGEHPSRTLFVRNISISDEELRQIFEQFGDIRSIYTQCKHRGFIMVSYYDIRHAKAAMKNLQNRRFTDGINKRRIDIHYSIPKEHPSEKDLNQGTLVVFNLDTATTNEELNNIFGKFGEIKEIRETPNKSHHKFIEFYDVRCAENAMKSLNRTELHGKRIKIEASRPGGVKRQLWSATGSQKSRFSLNNEIGIDLSQLTQQIGGYGNSNNTDSSFSSTSSSLDVSQEYFANSWGNNQFRHEQINNNLSEPKSRPPAPPSNKVTLVADQNRETEIMKIGGMKVAVKMEYLNSPPIAESLPNLVASDPPFVESNSSKQEPKLLDNEKIVAREKKIPIAKPVFGNKLNPKNVDGTPDLTESISEESDNLHSFDENFNSSPFSFSQGSSFGEKQDSPSNNKKITKTNSPNKKAKNPINLLENNQNSKSHEKSERNFHLDVSKVLEGIDKRTTIMIKNIPNKYTQQQLLKTIEERTDFSFEEKFDFFYLPIDFKNKCNVGYAFINFVDSRNIIDFATAFDNKKWEKFNSEKVCQISYARIQGRNSLINHFKNSTLMENSAECKPIFKDQGEF